jgi:hypothetical protein
MPERWPALVRVFPVVVFPAENVSAREEKIIS